METEANLCVSFVVPVLPPGDTAIFLGKRQNFPWRADRRSPSAVGEKPVTDDFRLLLKAVVLEASARLDLISVAAERVPHQRQIESPAFLRLPDMGQLVDEETLPMERLARKIVRPEVRVRVEVDVAHRGHGDALRLERPPFAADHSHALIIDRIAEDRTGKLDLAGCQRA